MAVFLLACPHCGAELEVQDEWRGMEVTCPNCQNPFVIPQQEYAAGPAMEQVPYPPPRRRKQKQKTEKKEKQDQGAWVKPVIKLVLFLILIGVGLFIYYKITAPTPENLKGNQLYAMTQKRANPDGSASGVQEIAKNDFFTIANSKEKFFYRDAQFTRISVGKDAHEMYSGTIFFIRGQSSKEQERPVVIDRTKTFTHYRFPLQYDSHPEHLEGDADLIFALATQIDGKLRDWKFVSAKVSDRSTLACVISKDGTQKTIHLKVKIVVPEDKIGRVWVEILPEKGK